MEQADVAQAIATLAAQGKAPSVQNLRRAVGYGSLRDIIKHRNACLTPQKEDTTMDTTTDTATLETTPVPLPLTEQAARRLQTAKEARNAALRARDYSRSNVALDYQVRETESEVRKAQGWVDQLEHSRDQLRQAIPEAARTLLIEESQLAALVETHRKAEARQAALVRQARQDLDRLRTDLLTVAGEAVP